MDIDGDVSTSTRAFIDSLDRSVLGDFAANWYAVYVTHKIQVYHLMSEDLSTSLSVGDMSYGIGTQLDEVTRLLRNAEFTLAKNFDEVEREAAAVELLYWWSVSDDPVMADNATRHSLFGRSERIAVIASSPLVMHDYFKAGIWDVDVVARCVDEGIDVELATSLSLSSPMGVAA